jgi:hypothetical protein
LAAAGRKNVSRHATVAWLKRKLFRRSGTQKRCRSRRIFAAARRGMARCAGVAQREGHDGKRHSQDNVGQKIKRRKDRKRLWIHPECKRGLRDVSLRQQLRVRKRIKELGVLPLCLKNKKTTNAIEGWSAGFKCDY